MENVWRKPDLQKSHRACNSFMFLLQLNLPQRTLTSPSKTSNSLWSFQDGSARIQNGNERENARSAHLVLLQPLLQVLRGIASVERHSDSAQDLLLALFQASVDLVYVTGYLASFGVIGSTFYSS